MCLVLEKKPRASKSSKRHTIGGLDFYFKMGVTELGGALKIYYDAKPYPYLHFIPQRHDAKTGWYSQEEIESVGIDWCIDNNANIIKTLKELDTYIKIQESVWREHEEQSSKKNGKVSKR